VTRVALTCVVGAALAFSGCTCRGPELEPVPSFIRVTPTQVDFGRFVLGQAEVRTITVENAGRAALEGSWIVVGDGFRSDDAVPSRAEVGSTVFTVICAPDRAGVFDGEVRIALTGFAPVIVPMSCEAVPVPECVPSGPCRTSSWDVSAGRCVERDVSDDTDCQGSDPCLLDAKCAAGRCEGRLRDCNDGDACTSDTCVPSTGCRHVGPVTCPNAGPCRVGACVAGQGCALTDAPDGTPCGQLRTCTLADVCIAGQCVQRDPPDGFTCAAESPCQATGRCVNDECVLTASTPLTPSWTIGDALPDGGLSPRAWSDVMVDRTGAAHLSSYFISPVQLGAGEPMPRPLAQLSRRCIVWLSWVVCGDLPATANSPISAIDPSTGQTVWTFGGAATRIAEFRGAGVEFFTARLAVLNENELLVLYESRTLMNGVDARVRVFAMIVLDRQGQPLRSLFINDPIFARQNHPHSYGVAIDAQSNVYLAFAPSSIDNPATALPETTLFSWSPALQLRWRVVEPALLGGELATAGGLLFHEGESVIRSTQTGLAVGSISNGRFGGGVMGSGLAVTAEPMQRSVIATETTGFTTRWSASVSGEVKGAPLTLARWASPWGPREVVLAFVQNSAGEVVLDGIELDTGAAAFSCPTTLQQVPLMTAMAPEGLVVMTPFDSTSDPCATCDPRFARTRNRFARLALPGLTPSDAPWSGTWGNEGHSHHEGR
jgi:hypothetical protein